MSSMTKKFKKNKLDLTMAIKFKCNTCGFERLVYQSQFKKMTNETFKDNKLFFCDKCNNRMNAVTVEVDY